MRPQARSWRSATSALLPVATAALAAGIFVAEVITATKLAVAICYVVVVLLAARFCSARGIVLVGAGCAGLTLLAFFVPGISETEDGGVGVKASIGVAVIGLATFLVTKSRRAMETLRESEKQWQEVFEHNPVMYFMVSPTGAVLSVNAFGAAQLGYTAAELIGQSVLTVFFEEDREFVRSHVAACLGELGCSHSWEIRKLRKDGSVLWVRENAKAVQRSGNDAVVLIACEDITERRRAEQRAAAAYAVTRVLAEADSFGAAAPHILRAIGENLEWDWGALWSFDRERAQRGAPLRCDSLWHGPDIETAEFATATRQRGYASGDGRLGQVWRTAKPIWMVDATTDPQFLRAAAAVQAGLHGGVIFPILLDAEPLGVVEFFSRAAPERDEDQLATLSAIGSQIGQLIKRQRAEASLRASEERWRTLFETSAAGMALSRLDGVFTAANPALQRMLGRAEEEIVGHSVLELNHEDERAATAEALAKYSSGSVIERHVEKKYLRKDGTPVWLNITTTLVPATDATGPFLQSVYMDISERVQFEAALRASEGRWRAIFETAAVGITTLDFAEGVRGNRYVTANTAFQRMTGYAEDELRNLTPLEITHEDDRAATQKLRAEAIAGARNYRIEKRYRRKDGGIFWGDASTVLVPATESTPAFYTAIVVDITERKRAEEALRETEERFRTLVQFSFDVYWESDADHRFIRQEFAEGLADAPPLGSEIGKTRWEVPYLEPDAEAWRAHRETLDAHLPFRDFEHARPTPDGGKRYVSVSGLPVFDETGRFIGYRGVGRHITDRKRAEAALRASEERWRAMFETAPVGIATFDFEQRRYLTANQSFQRITGYTEAELRNLTTLELTHEDDRAAMQERIDSGAIEILQRKRYRRKDGEAVWADVTSFVVPATDSTPAFRGAVIVDITDRKRAEAALQQAQADLARLNRVMLLGEMTASIAHEVNQPIAATVTNAHAGLRWLGARPPDLGEARQALGRIVRDGSRAGEVIDRIRALVKKVPPRRDYSDINEAIREVIALTQTEVQQNRIRLQTRLADALPLVPADRVQLQQVIMNLTANAIEAMSSVDDRSRELTITSGKGDANVVVVEVQDTGPGIDPADLDRLFQSFYTTKPDGIGMGLAISRSIVEAHGGGLSAAPNQPHGAVFRFTLPVEEKPEGAPSHRVDMMRSVVVQQQGVNMPHSIPVPPEIIRKWQEILDLTAEIMHVPSALIMRVEPPNIKVFVSSGTQENPYERDEVASLNTGLYCETVMKTRQPLLIPDALRDEAWKSNPDIKLGMISYLGLPIVWPDGEVFGTICVLDKKPNEYSELYRKLLLQWRDLLQADLRSLATLHRELEARETKLRRLVEVDIIGIFAWDLEGQVIEANDAFLNIVGYDREDLASGRLRWTDITPPEWLDRDVRQIVPEIKLTGRCQPFEKEYFRKDGTRVPVLIGIATLEEGANQGIAFVLDISERKRAERALRDSEELKRRIIESSRDCIKVLDLDGNLLFMSSGGQQLLEIDNIQPYVNTCWINFWQPEDRPKISEAIAAARAGGIGKFQAFCPSAKGAPRWWDVITTPICNADGQPEQLLSVSRDITESKQAEAEARESERGYREMQMALAHANRVATMGQLSASIAHEINQPIAAVIANANAGLRWLGARPPDLNEARQALGRIVRDGTRAGEVIDRIRSLVKKTPPCRDRLDINEATREVIPLTQAELQRNRVSLQTRLADGLPLVSGDRVQLQQVITNLIINAVEAMAGAGDGPRALTIVSGIGDANDVVVEVQDTGPGLDPEQLDRLFQSFYTTKPDGIGMGLAISRSIAEAHGGRLSAAPNNPRGAVFRLTLPLEQPLSGDKSDRAPSRRLA